MAKDNLLFLEGQVIEEFRDARFRVEVLHGDIKIPIMCYLSGKMRLNKIKIITGDFVKVEVPKSLHLQNAIGRITFRLK